MKRTGIRVALAVLVGAVVIGLVVLAPWLAITQAAAFPVLWLLLKRMRLAIIGNVLFTVGVATTMAISWGDLPGTLFIESISLAVSIALGVWINGIARRSEERARLLDELRSTQEQLAAVNRDAGVASERERLAREIHDTIAQDLTGIVLLAQGAARSLNSGETAAAAERMQVLEDSARSALAETRALVSSSAPPALESGDVLAAIERLGVRFERESGVAVTVVGTPGPLDRAAEVVLLRCAQEGLANVRKHAAARSVTVTLVGGSLTVSDDGRGFDTASENYGYGLAGMRDRLALVGGSLAIASGASGTTLSVEVPS